MRPSVESGADPAWVYPVSQQSAHLTASSRSARLLIISGLHWLSRFPVCVGRRGRTHSNSGGKLFALDLVFRDLAAEGVAMQADQLRGAADVALAQLQGMDDVAALELPPRILVQDAVFHHLAHQRFQFGAHAGQAPSSRPVSRRNASMYFSLVRATTSSGRDGTGGCLFHRIDSR